MAATGSHVLGSIVVSISACHAEDPGSIPGRGAAPPLLAFRGRPSLRSPSDSSAAARPTATSPAWPHGFFLVEPALSLPTPVPVGGGTWSPKATQRDVGWLRANQGVTPASSWLYAQ